MTTESDITAVFTESGEQEQIPAETHHEPNLHGGTLQQIQDHCHPTEWLELQDNPAALEAVAADLAHHPILLSTCGSDAREAAAREAAEERAAILEHEAHLQRQDAERVAGLAQDYYRHLFGTGKDSGCCFAPAGRLCPEGQRLRALYFDAAERAGSPG